MHFTKSKATFINTSLIAASAVIIAITNWGQLSIITQHFDLKLIGVYTLAIAASNPIFQFFRFQLESLYVSDQKKEFSYQDYFSLRIITTTCAILIGLILSYFLNDNAYDRMLFVAVFFYYASDAIVTIMLSKVHFLEKYKIYSFAQILIGLSSFLVIWTSIKLTDNLFLAIFSGFLIKAILSYLLVFRLFFYKLSVQNELGFSINNKTLKLFKKALYLGFVLLAGALNVNLPKYFINHNFGLEVQGAFSTMSYLIVVGSIAVASLGQVLLPKLGKLYKENNFNRILNLNLKYLFLILMFSLLFFFISHFYSEEILTLAFSSRIADYSYLFQWVVGSAIFLFLASAQGVVLTALGDVKQQTITALVAVSINLILNIIFFQEDNIVLPIVFFGISFCFQFVVNFIFLLNKVNIK